MKNYFTLELLARIEYYRNNNNQKPSSILFIRANCAAKWNAKLFRKSELEIWQNT